MKTILAIFAALLLCGTLCAAQDNAADQNSTESVAAAAASSRAQINARQAEEKDIRELVEVTGAAGIGIQSMDETAKSIRPLLVDALPPGEYRDKLVDLFFEKFHAKVSSGQLVDLIVPVYEKYYSDDEIKQLIQLYQSPIGKKMLVVLPKVMAESRAAGEKWGQDLGRQCMIEVLAEHPEMRAAIEQAKVNTKPQ